MSCMRISPTKRSSAGTIPPVGHMLGNTFVSFAKSRLPIPNKPRTRPRRAFLNVAPIPFAPLVDRHAFQPPPPYSAHAADPLSGTPEEPAAENTSVVRTVSHTRPVGLGLEGVEKGDGEQFDGLGRLSGGFRGLGDPSEQVHRTLRERRRMRTREPPAKEDDVFYASVEVCDRMASLPRGAVQIRIGRSTSCGGWDVGRATISSELKRAASLARRASMAGVETRTNKCTDMA